MGIRVDTPWLLALLFPLAGYMIWLWRTGTRLRGTRKRISTCLRALVMLLLIFALSGLSVVRMDDAHSVLFVLDRSASMPHDSAPLEWIKQADASKSLRDRSGIVAFGPDATVERQLSTETLSPFSSGAAQPGQFTNMEGGLKLAGGLLKDWSSPRIVLISDGLDNVGDALREARLLKDRGIPVDIMPIQRGGLKDATVEAVSLPEKLYEGEAYSIDVRVTSSDAAEAVLRVYEDQTEIAAQPVTLEKGENHFALRGLAHEPGLHRYRAELYWDGDGQPANNTAYAFSRVTGPPKVLIVEGAPGSSQNITRALDASLLLHDTIQPEQLPREMADLTSYEAIVLNNVPATRFSKDALLRIEQAVRDFGIGLTMLGGDDSFGVGGYFDTPVEKALPVYMDLRGKQQLPTLGLALVIDKSGSMQGDKIALAQEAASRTVQFLRDQDSLGVLAFDSSPWWVVPLQKLQDKEKAVGAINSIQADGGTEIYTALEEAFRGLAKVEAQRKHIILLTDGQSATNQSYQALATEMEKEHITVSTVAVGQDADRQLLETIAKLAGGRYYYTDDQSTVPAIFSREAVMMTRTYIVDQPFQPVRGVPTEWDSLFSGGVPTLGGYVATTPKETAEVVLQSPEPDPILARWQYGSGRSVAWTSDMTGGWSSNWISWPNFAQTLTDMIKWTFPQFAAAPLELSASLDGRQAQLTVNSADHNFQGSLKAIVTGEDLRPQQLELTPEAPGQYSAILDQAAPGVYVAQLQVFGQDADQADAPIGSVTTGFVIPYSPEYRLTTNGDQQKLARIAEMTGGRLLTSGHPEEVFDAPRHAAREARPLERQLLISAVLAWVLDVALRRVSVDVRGLLIALLSRMRQSSGRGQPAEADPGLARLLRRKETATEHRPASDPLAASPTRSSRPTSSKTITASSPLQAARTSKSGHATPPYDAAAGNGEGSRGAGETQASPPERHASAAPSSPTQESSEDRKQEAMARLLSAKNRTKR